MFKRDKYHNCFQMEKKFEHTGDKKNKHIKKDKAVVKSAHEKLESVVSMLEFFGWDTKNIEELKKDWFLLEE